MARKRTNTADDGMTRLSVRITREFDRRIKLHSIMTGKSVEKILVELLDTLPSYVVTPAITSSDTI